MASYPRREKAEWEARERAAMQPALDCQACGVFAPGARFRYCGDRVICEACNQQYPQSRVRTLQRELRRLLAYLGAMPAQLAGFDRAVRRWGQGTVRFTLELGRKNLLRLRE